LELYEFQVEDVDKIHQAKSGLIGSEMGTGKTLEAIRLDESWFGKNCNPTLVIAPLNTFGSWQEKYGILSPASDVVTIDRKNRGALVDAMRKKAGDVFLMHWDALRLMPELANFNFNTIIADEVHRAASRKSQTTQALFRLSGKHRVAMSGTASGDNPVNLWSVNHFLWPTYYRSYWKFYKYYVIEGTIYKNNDDGTSRKIRTVIGFHHLDQLREEMEPWYVRHLKRDKCCDHHPQGVMSWLPEKTYDKIWVDLLPTQRRVYNQMRDQMIAWVGKHENEPLAAGVAVAQLARLSQMCLATPTVRWEKRPIRGKLGLDGQQLYEDTSFVDLSLPSSKLDALLEILKDNPTKQFVVFSASKKMCYLAQRYLKEKNIGSFVLSGDTPQSQRDGMVERFVRGDTQLFIGVIEAAAEGIDGLQHATDTAIFLDRSWRTIKNQQAEDRLHRGGQENTVQIIDIMAKDTIDMGRFQKLEMKWAWIKTILGDTFDNSKLDFSLTGV
jgi:SNF2 family DNA or RNA helicase